jgi:hypothetical protein
MAIKHLVSLFRTADATDKCLSKLDLIQVGFLLGIIIHHDHGGSTVLRNYRVFLPDYTALLSTR